jgi:hypothetical protein
MQFVYAILQCFDAILQCVDAILQCVGEIFKRIFIFDVSMR